MLFKENPYNVKEYNIIKQIEFNQKIKSINNQYLDDLLEKMINLNNRISW